MKFSNKEIFFTGLALLAMFFGAGNLIFPPMLGLQSGEQLPRALFGFIVTGVGLPLLGVTAVAKAGGDLELLANRVHPLFSKIITTLAILCIGPLLAIPRTAATTFEVAIVPFLATNSSSTQIALVLTTIIFFAITLFFVLRPSDILENVGKILTPLLILFLGLIIFKGVINPLGSIGASNYTNPFSQGFLEGYNTMDAIASVIFGMIIVKGIKDKGVTNNSEIAKVTIIAGIIAAIGLASIYIGLAYIGATTGTTFNGDSHGQMLSYISEALYGASGKIIIALVMSLACLTTAIGLVASCGEYFSRLTNYRLSYSTVAIITTLISALLANMGLSKILSVSVPILVNIYPIIIVLVLLALFHNFFKGKKEVYVFTVCGVLLILIANIVHSLGASLGINLTFINQLLSYLPFQEQGLGWVVPALFAAIFAMLGSINKRSQS
ncbi:MAG: branched-chain amino acid transport system II carrier protein [Peptococcales bacterium]|jgi:LIVCS family branched-chain amino acid:cation transporter